VALDRPFMDYHSLKDWEKTQSLAEKSARVLETNPQHAVRKLEKYYHRISHILQTTSPQHPLQQKQEEQPQRQDETLSSLPSGIHFDEELLGISKKIAHVIREKLLTMQMIQNQLALLTARDGAAVSATAAPSTMSSSLTTSDMDSLNDDSNALPRSQSANAIGSHSDFLNQPPITMGITTSTSFWSGRKKKSKNKEGVSSRPITKPPLPLLQPSQTMTGLSGKQQASPSGSYGHNLGKGVPGQPYLGGGVGSRFPHRLRRESAGSDISTNGTAELYLLTVQEYAKKDH
jgi:hypothetical protein